jgi:hypothetical protein
MGGNNMRGSQLARSSVVLILLSCIGARAGDDRARPVDPLGEAADLRQQLTAAEARIKKLEKEKENLQYDVMDLRGQVKILETQQALRVFKELQPTLPEPEIAPPKLPDETRIRHFNGLDYYLVPLSGSR